MVGWVYGEDATCTEDSGYARTAGPSVLA